MECRYFNCFHSLTHIGTPTHRTLVAIYSIYSILIFHSIKYFIYLFLERGEGEREGEKPQCANVWLCLTCPPPRTLSATPGMCPDQESNQRPSGSQAATQSTETHQPGPHSIHSCSWLYIWKRTISSFILLILFLNFIYWFQRERDLLFHLVIYLLVDSVCALIRGNMHSLSLSGLCSNQPRYPAKTILLTLNFLLFSIFQPGSGCGREIISIIFCCQKFYRDSIYSFWINLWIMW